MLNHGEEDQEMGVSERVSEGWPPRIAPRSGLEPRQKADLRRLHSNLGHPHPGKFLSEQGADEAVVKAARLSVRCLCKESARSQVVTPIKSPCSKEFQ